MCARQKTVLVGVTGCIAAYKSCEIVRALQKSGIRVKVVMTEHATEFVGPTTFRALMRDPVAVGLFDEPGAPIHHISLAQEADCMLIAPCTANVIAKMALGMCDDLLTTTALATKAPIIIAPAMNVNMYEHVATQRNIQILRERGCTFVEPNEGFLACGDTGKGRLADIDTIVQSCLSVLDANLDMAGLRVLITAGPTQEPIDAVRCITNHSSGKMGYSIAEAAAARGAHVELVSGPVSLSEPQGVHVHRVSTAQQMLDACEQIVEACDIVICTAAVCDFRPAVAADGKLKKGQNTNELAHIELVQNPDILATLAAREGARTIVGFAAETNDVVEYAQSKLVSKKADLIVANDVSGGKVFGSERNEVHLVTADGVEHIPEMDKVRLADVVLDKTLSLFDLKRA